MCSPQTQRPRSFRNSVFGGRKVATPWARPEAEYIKARHPEDPPRFPPHFTFLLLEINIFVIMDYGIRYYNEAVLQEILALPVTLAARYVVLTRRMVAVGPHLGEPHTKAMGQGLFELRLKGAEGIARVFYCTQVGKRIVMLHSFVKKTNRTPRQELDLARLRIKELKHEDA
jgi:phage-related protein